MEVFWAEGHEAASVPALSAAMGISPQSLYAAYGSKDALYREALDLYATTLGGFGERALEGEADAIRAVARLLEDAAKTFARTEGAPGCMITMAPSGLSETPLILLGRRLRAEGPERVAARLKRGVVEGQVAPNADLDAWSRYVASVVQGLSVQARDGATAEMLLQTARIAGRSLDVLRVANSA